METPDNLTKPVDTPENKPSPESTPHAETPATNSVDVAKKTETTETVKMSEKELKNLQDDMEDMSDAQKVVYMSLIQRGQTDAQRSNDPAKQDKIDAIMDVVHKVEKKGTGLKLKGLFTAITFGANFLKKTEKYAALGNEVGNIAMQGAKVAQEVSKVETSLDGMGTTAGITQLVQKLGTAPETAASQTATQPETAQDPVEIITGDAKIDQGLADLQQLATTLKSQESMTPALYTLTMSGALSQFAAVISGKQDRIGVTAPQQQTPPETAGVEKALPAALTTSAVVSSSTHPTESSPSNVVETGFMDDDYDPSDVDENARKEFAKMKPEDAKVRDRMRPYPEIVRDKKGKVIMTYCAKTARQELKSYFDVTAPAGANAMAVMEAYGDKPKDAIVAIQKEYTPDIKGDVFEIFTHSNTHPELGHAIWGFRSYPSGKVYVCEGYVKGVPHDKPIPIEDYVQKVCKNMKRPMLKIVGFDTKTQVVDDDRALASLQKHSDHVNIAA